MIRTYYDISSVGTCEITAEGFLKFDAVASRSGIFIYHRDGKTLRAYRPPEEVFKPCSLESFKLKPIINNHAEGVTPKITADNATDFQIGTIGENIRRDGNNLRISGVITSKGGIDAVKAGRKGLSLAYDSEDVMTPGMTPEGLEYDFMQTNINGNHLAIVDAGRAGPNARINMDSADINEQPETTKQPLSRSANMKFNLDGVEVDAPECVITALTAARGTIKTHQDAATAAAAQVATLQSNLDTVTAARDALTAEVTTLKAIDNNKLVQDAIDARVKLLESASLICDAADLKGKNDGEIRLAVIGKVYPKLSMDGKSEDYIAGMFESAIVTGDTAQRREAIARQRRTVAPLPRTHADGSPVLPGTTISPAEAIRMSITARAQEPCSVHR